VNKSTKLIVTGAASILGVVLAASGAYAATGSLSVSDAPGQVLKVSGVGPASEHASDNAKAHANENAKGLFGTTDAATDAEAGTTTDAEDTTVDGTVDGDAETSSTVAPVAPTTAAKNASTVKGNETGKSVEAWAHSKGDVETVAPDAAVSVDADADADVDADADADAELGVEANVNGRAGDR
jgi:hypothetical protein